MILSDFRTLIRLYIPSAKVNVVSNGTLNTLINKAVDDVNEFSLAYKGEKKINVIAEDQDITISDDIDDFLTMDNSGIWWNSGSAASPNWIKLDPFTRESLDNEYPIWRDDDSDDPQRYFLENNLITFHPKPDTSLDSGFWVFYIKVASSMTSDSQYPFTGTTTEITELKVLDDAIIDYVRWKLARPLGADAKGTISKQDYVENLILKSQQLNRRLDLTGSPHGRMRGLSIGK